MFQIEISAKFFDGVAKFHIFVVIRLVILAKSFEHFNALLVAVRAYEPCKKRIVLALVKIADKPHKYCLVALVLGKNFHEHFARLALRRVDFVNHIFENRLAIFHKILVRFEPLMIGQILVQKDVEIFEHICFRFDVGRQLFIRFHLHLRK